MKRNLTAAEIVEQAVYARRLLSHEVGSITNVVFMVCMKQHTCHMTASPGTDDMCVFREWESHFITLTMSSKLQT